MSTITISPLPSPSSPSYAPLSAALTTAQYDAYTSPPSNIFTLFCPLSRTPGTSREDALKELIARHEAWRTWDTGVWVVAKRGEEVVGGACWYFNQDQGDTEKAGEEGGEGGAAEGKEGAGEGFGDGGIACWWPPGPGRKVADKLLLHLMASRGEITKGPHARNNPWCPYR